jgi:multidrug efflux pump subunit AcrA (membrane-fusion protein)
MSDFAKEKAEAIVDLALAETEAELERAEARLAKAELTPAEVKRLKLLATLAEKKAEARTAETSRRALRGAELKAEAAKAAGGKYLVDYFDLGALLPDVDPDKLPGEGVLIVRSPPTSPVDALAHFYRELEAKEHSLVDIYTDLVCASVVVPNVMEHATGMMFRNFLESSIGRGTAIQIGDAVTSLGGARNKQTKRGRG